MNMHFWTRGWMSLLLGVLLLFQIFVLLMYRSLLNPFVLLGLFFSTSFSALFLGCQLSLALNRGSMNGARLTMASGEPTMQMVVAGEVLPAIPRTASEAFALLSDAQFEIFSAAVIIALGEGHRFLAHCGQSGDQGIDAKLLNLFNYTVVVQSKRYAPDNSVGQPLLRDFLGSIYYHKAAYGYFVTTSYFTAAAQQFIAGTNGRIRAIDGRLLELYLQRRSREIELALRDILD